MSDQECFHPRNYYCSLNWWCHLSCRSHPFIHPGAIYIFSFISLLFQD